MRPLCGFIRQNSISSRMKTLETRSYLKKNLKPQSRHKTTDRHIIRFTKKSQLIRKEHAIFQMFWSNLCEKRKLGVIRVNKIARAFEGYALGGYEWSSTSPLGFAVVLMNTLLSELSKPWIFHSNIRRIIFIIHTRRYVEIFVSINVFCEGIYFYFNKFRRDQRSTTLLRHVQFLLTIRPNPTGSCWKNKTFVCCVRKLNK